MRRLILAIILLAALTSAARAQSIGATQGLSGSAVSGSPGSPGGSSGSIQTNNGSGGFGAYGGSGPLAAHNFANQISSSGAITGAQPAFTDISGSVAAGQLPNPSASTLGGVQSFAAVSHQWINTVSTSGIPAASQPAFADISGTATTAQLPVAQQAAIAMNIMTNSGGL
ncbi:MAG: hypothetical protein JOZ29_15670 [Deltaproteobacteria bacterium]|nr:hypothetical protein [Deltaproteobacteria bacterium]